MGSLSHSRKERMLNYLDTSSGFYAWFNTKTKDLKRKFPNARFVLLGHSLSGVFAFNQAYRSYPLFDEVVLMSPSLRVNNYQSLEYFETLGCPVSNVSIVSGSQENFNKNNKGVAKALERSKAASCIINHRFYPGYNHNNYVSQAFKDIVDR